MLDTARPDYLSVYGHPRPTSPYLKEFAATGTRYDRAYSTASWTLPAHASLFSGTLAEILIGPAHENDGRMNLFGALRTSMATCGYETLKEFQKAEVMVAPALQTEGKALQRAQRVGMGH